MRQPRASAIARHRNAARIGPSALHGVERSDGGFPILLGNVDLADVELRVRGLLRIAEILHVRREALQSQIIIIRQIIARRVVVQLLARYCDRQEAQQNQKEAGVCL